MNENKNRQCIDRKGLSWFESGMMNEEVCKLFLKDLLGVTPDRIKFRNIPNVLARLTSDVVWLEVWPEEGEAFKAAIQFTLTDHQPLQASFLHCILDDPVLFDSSIKDSYVILLCVLDPGGLRDAQLRVETFIKGVEGTIYNDGMHTIFLQIYYTKCNAPKSILSLLDYLRTGKDPSTELAKAFSRAEDEYWIEIEEEEKENDR